MSTLKKMYELYKPNKKAEGEQKFIAKHVTVKKDDPAGNKDDVFNASNVKAIDRKADDHGYNPGEDEKVYEGKEVGRLVKEEVELSEAAQSRVAKNYDFHRNEVHHYLKEIGKAVEDHSKAAAAHKTYSGRVGHTWGHSGDMEHVHRTLRDIHQFLKNTSGKGIHESVNNEEELSLEDEVLADLLDEFFAALTEEEMAEVQRLIDMEDEEGLDQYIADNFDRVFEGRDWEAGEWHSQMASKSTKPSKVQHHLVKDGKRLSSHDSEGAAMSAFKSMKDNKGVKIVKEETFEEEIDIEEAIDKEHVYKVHVSDNRGRTWDHHPGDVYHSLDRAKRVAHNIGKGTSRLKTKITRHPRQKLAGPVGKLPEGIETILEDGISELDEASNRTHVVYTVQAKQKRDNAPDVLHHARVAVKKGDDAEDRARKLAGSHFNSKVGSHEILRMSKALAPQRHDVKEGWAEMMKAVKDRQKEKGTGEFEKKKISTGTVYQRKPARWDDYKTKKKKGDE